MNEIDNTVIREKALISGMTLIVAMSVSAFVLVADQLIGAYVIAGLLLLYSLSIIAFSAYFSKAIVLAVFLVRKIMESMLDIRLQIYTIMKPLYIILEETMKK